MDTVTYYFVLGSKQFLTTDEPLEEVLRERIQYYARTKKRVDFWILPAPKFLQAPAFSHMRERFPQSDKSLAIISTNKIFITWLKIRLQNVFVGKFQAPTEEIKNPLDYELIS